mmetsp:Transcript_30075/g.62853  ORF Transcript_30075/g.62853 Transcript_30075/m.62853 type:complete len:172 (-) Transcript_30075:20-535(-)
MLSSRTTSKGDGRLMIEAVSARLKWLAESPWSIAAVDRELAVSLGEMVARVFTSHKGSEAPGPWSSLAPIRPFCCNDAGHGCVKGGNSGGQGCAAWCSWLETRRPRERASPVVNVEGDCPPAVEDSDDEPVTRTGEMEREDRFETDSGTTIGEESAPTINIPSLQLLAPDI